MSQAKPRPNPTPDELLHAVPVQNARVSARRRGKSLVLAVPVRQRWFNGPPFSWLLPFRKERVYGLDTIGEEVWKACNGRRTTEQIIEDFAQRHRLRFHEARLSVMQFLRMLAMRKLIALVGPSGPHDDTEGLE